MPWTDPRELFQAMHKRLGMFVAGGTYAEACAFIDGYDIALQGGALAGFREWLVVRTGDQRNLAWSALVQRSVLPDANWRELTDEQNLIANDALFSLLDEYLALGKLENRLATAMQLYNQLAVARWRCLCCGYLTMTDKPPGTHQICQVCFWHDDWVDAVEFTRAIGPNSVGLKTARDNFLMLGACEERWMKHVRAPTEFEHPRLPLENLDPATDLLLRTKFPRRSDEKSLEELFTSLAYWSTFVDCIVFPLHMGLPAVDSGPDVWQRLVELKAKLEARLANQDDISLEKVQELLSYCDLLMEVWSVVRPRWTAGKWTID